MNLFNYLRDFFLVYLPERRHRSQQTIKAYRQTFNLWRTYWHDVHGLAFQQLSFSHVTQASIYEFLHWLKEKNGSKASTLNLRLASIKSFLKFCAETDIELTSLYVDVSKIRAFKDSYTSIVDYLSESQLKLLFSLPDVASRLGRRNRFLIIFLYETGARIQEALDLKLASIHMDDSTGRITFHGKGDKYRTIPLLNRTCQHVRAYLTEFHAHPNSSDFLFYTIHDGRPSQMKSGTVDRFLKQYAQLARIVDCQFPSTLHAHMFRHSIAMAMYRNGIPLSYIRDFLGHSSIESTHIYARADEGMIAAALEKVPCLQFDNDPQTKLWKGKEYELVAYCGLI